MRVGFMEALLRMLSRYGDNVRWIRENYEELKKFFKDEWVAVLDKKVIDHDRDLSRLVRRLREKRLNYGEIAIEYIATREIELILQW
mgnify:CR=1 FL=1